MLGKLLVILCGKQQHATLLFVLLGVRLQIMHRTGQIWKKTQFTYGILGQGKPSLRP
jgi:hypothetical protein